MAYFLGKDNQCEIIAFDPPAPLSNANPSPQQETPTTNQPESSQPSESNGSILPMKTNFKKGHRRAYSMPSAHKDKSVLVMAEAQVRQEGRRKRHVVRYRLHPYKPTPKVNMENRA